MTQKRLFDGIDNRIALDKEDGDHAYFHALSLKLEYVTKIVTSGVIRVHWRRCGPASVLP